MNIQTSNNVSVIASQMRTTLATINQDVADSPEKLFTDLMAAGLSPSGPMMFIYTGVTPDPHNEFDLRIALPVSKEDAAKYAGSNLSIRFEPFHFVEAVLHGNIAQLGPDAYEPLLADLGKAGLKMTGFLLNPIPVFFISSV